MRWPRAGVHELETTSFVSPKAIPQLADATELMARVPRAGIVDAALVANLAGAKRAASAGVDRLVSVISASSAHNMANLLDVPPTRRWPTLMGIFAVAREQQISVVGAVAVAFGCPFQGDVSLEDVFTVAAAFASRGASAILLADTTGMATPTRIDTTVRRFQDQFSEVDLILHLHNNRGTAMANLLAALQTGVRHFDTALGGIGGCPNVPQAAGNLATEDVVYMLEDMGVTTGIDLEAIIMAARLLETIVGTPLPGQVMKTAVAAVDRESASNCEERSYHWGIAEAIWTFFLTNTSLI